MGKSYKEEKIPDLCSLPYSLRAFQLQWNEVGRTRSMR